MKAIIRTSPGKEFSTMKVMHIDSPITGPHDVKVKMYSSRINPVDMDLMKGFPSLRYKNPQLGGVDGSGIVVDTGSAVHQFKPGDNVFFYRLFSDIGTWAEEITIPADHVAMIPSNLSILDAGSITLPLLTAFEAILAIQPSPNETILIHGAGGGVGLQAVQIAVKRGLKVIANASEKDHEVLSEAGINQFIDYKHQDFFQVLQQTPPDYVLDLVGKETLIKSIRLRPKAVVSTTFPDVNQLAKTGVKFPGILKFLMRLLNRKYERLAAKNGVRLIGQVTGANGKLLQNASDLIGSINPYLIRSAETLTLDDVSKNGLTKNSIGKILLLHEHQS